MSTRKEWEMAFMLSASMSGSYSATFSKAQMQIVAMQKEIDALSKTQSDISAYQKQQQAVEATKSKLEMLKQQYANIQQEMDETGESSAALKNQLLAKQQQIEKTERSLESQNAKLENMGHALEEAGVDTKNLTGESKKLEEEIKDLQQKEEDAADNAEKFGDKASAAFAGVGQVLAAAGIQKGLEEIYDAYAKCVDVSAGFESAMSQVAATMGVSSDEVPELADFAKEMGASTSFSAVQAAEGLNILAMAGLDADNQIAALPTVLDLAAAGAMGMATAAGFVTGAVKGFGDSMDNAGYYADLMAKGATMANTNVTQLGEALSGTAATASAYGQSADTTTLALLRLAEQNVVGSEASTKLARAMADLYTPTDEASGALEELGIAVYDANGDARDFNDVIDDLNGALQGYTVEQQNALKNTIFTTNGLKAFNEMTVSSAEKVESFYSGLKNASGSATQQAATQLDNYNGALTIMNSALEGTEISIGEIFLPLLTKLVSMFTNILTAVNTFVQKHPGVVKAVTAFIAVVGLAVGALTAYVAISKIVVAVNAAVTASIPGVNIIMGVVAAVAALTAVVVGLTGAEASEEKEVRELTESSRQQYYQLQELNEEYENAVEVYGENSEEAAYLRWQIDELSSSYENSKQSLSDYLAECDEMNTRLRDSLDTNRETVESLDMEETTTLALVHRLQELAAENSNAVASQEEMKAIIAELNDVVPDLALNYEDVVGGVSDWADAVEAAVVAQAAAERYQAAQEGMIDAYNAQYEAELKLKELEEEKAAAEERLNTANDEYLDYLVQISRYDTTGMSSIAALFSSEHKEVKAAEEALAGYDAQIAETQATIDQAAEDYEYYNGLLVDYVETVQQEYDAEQAVSNAITEVMTKVQELAKAYDEAYQAALTSVQGQYQLWDEAAEIVATSAETINSNLQGQATYWQQYNDNLANLRERTADIEGLDAVISSFADGSSDSVNAVAGMASATDEELADMVANWQKLQKEQDDVAANIAELKTNFTSEMDSLTSELEADIEEMNFSESAAESGKATIQGFIDGAELMRPQVQAAYASIAQAAINAIDAKLDIHSPSRVMAEKADYTWAGFLNETYAMQNEVEKAMSATVGAGVDSLQTEQMQIVAIMPQLLQALSGNLISADSSGFGGPPVSVSVTFQIEGNANGDTVEGLREYGDEFAERVLEVLSEAGVDADRRAYK